MSDQSSTSSVRIGPSGAMLLTMLFVILRVMNKIDWSWWWVFSPLWISAIIGLLILGVVIVVAVIAAVLDK